MIAINARIQANNLSLKVSGSQILDAKTTASQLSSNLVPMLAIDTGDLGGMYAEKIELISIEQGAGVNLNNVDAGSDGMQINVNGQLTFGNAISLQNMKIIANQLHMTGKQIASREINIHSRGETQLDAATLLAGQQLTIQIDDQFTSNASRLNSGLLDIHCWGNISLDSSSKFTAGQMSINGQRLNLAGELLAYTHLGVSGTFLQGTNTANFESGENMLITVSEHNLWAGKMWAYENLEFHSGHRLENQDTLIGKNIILSANHLINHDLSYDTVNKVI